MAEHSTEEELAGSPETTRRDPRTSRRTFLKVAGITGAGIVVAGAGVGGFFASRGGGVTPTPTATLASASGVPSDPSKFGIMFPQLRAEPFAEPGDAVRQALLEVGKQGGIMDALDDLTIAPDRLLFDAAVNGSAVVAGTYGRAPANPTSTHGSTFFGQFITHDMTFDATTVLGSPANPLLTPNNQTPALDLDGVFGGGPKSHPELYEGAKVKIGTGGVYETLPSTAKGDGSYKVLIPDGRNAQTLTLEGLTVAYMLAYNRVVDEIESFDLSRFPAVSALDLSDAQNLHLAAREIILWHYHWLIVNEYLPQAVGQEMTDSVVRDGNKFYNPPSGNAYMPVEFNSASFKFGHAQSNPSFRANFSSGTGASADPAKQPFYGLGFDASLPMERFNANTFDRGDMLGGYPAARRYLGWQSFYDFGDGQVLQNRRIDPKITSVLFTLPIPAIPGSELEFTVLPQRDLLRVLTWALPPGQAVARQMGVEALAASDLEEIGSVYSDFATKTPMWYYELAEAKAVNDGLHLGPVGGRIVAETILGILRDDQGGYLNQNPDFQPFLGSDLKLGASTVSTIAGSRDYTHAQLLYYAGVVEPGVYR